MHDSDTMNDLERDAERLLARYMAEERPPPAVDVLVYARIRREARRHTRRMWLGTACIAAAASLLLLWAVDPRGSLRSERTAPVAAVYAKSSDGVRPAIQGAAEDRPEQAPQPTPIPVPAESRAPHDALLDARRHIDAGDHGAALELLEPCPQKIGTDALLEDCEVLVIEAMCRSGDLDAGRRRIARIRGHWPGSIQIKRLSKFCPE